MSTRLPAGERRLEQHGRGPRCHAHDVEEALGGIPTRFRKYLENVAVMVEEEPSAEDYEETDTPDEDELFGIFRGIQVFDRGVRDEGRGGAGDPRHRRARDRPHARAG